jgi:hypothetical protein
MKDEPNILSIFGSRSGHYHTELRKRDITLDNKKPHTTLKTEDELGCHLYLTEFNILSS